MHWLPRNPRFWLGAFIFWFIVLFTFSSFKLPGPEEPPIANFDKIAHFGFFFGGSGLLCAYLYRRQTGTVNWKKLILTAVIIISIVGALDEYHQSFTPGRTGNDQYDWLADILGGISGAFIFKFLHRWLK